MSIDTKYLVLRVDDMRAHLTPEMKLQLRDIVKAVVDGRAAAGKNEGILFMLNLETDLAAVRAVEAYIAACEDMPDAAEPGRLAAAKTARDLRLRALMAMPAYRTPD